MCGMVRNSKGVSVVRKGVTERVEGYKMKQRGLGRKESARQGRPSLPLDF